jgi:hypothetical protein
VSQRAGEQRAVGESGSRRPLGPGERRIVVGLLERHGPHPLLKMRVALCPPKPKELLMTASTRACRAVLAT